MQKIESRLSIISRTLCNESLNSFEFNLNGSGKYQLFQTTKERSESKDYELNYLINSWKLYSIVCPSLSSYFLARVANLTSEIKKSKLYEEFFFGKICPKCFSTYLAGLNCRMVIKSIRGKTKHKIKNKLKQLSKLNNESLTKYNFKRISIKCYICEFNYNKIFWDKKRHRKNADGNHISNDEKSRTVDNFDQICDYSNDIIRDTKLNSAEPCKIDDRKKLSETKKFNHKNNRFFSTNNVKAGMSTQVNHIDVENNQKSLLYSEKNTKNKFVQGSSFYDILSKLG